jgi:F0F1-type ATP synthase assembly protein I
MKPEPDPLLRLHRDLVSSTTRVSPAVMFGSSFAVAMGLFAWLGHSYDEKHGTAPLGVLLGVCLGFGYGGYEVWKVTRSAKPAATPDAEPKGQGGYSSLKSGGDPDA